MSRYVPDRRGLEQFSKSSPGLQRAVRQRTETGVGMAKADAPRDTGEYARGIEGQYGESRIAGMTRFSGWIVATSEHSAAVEYPSSNKGDRGSYVLTRIAERLTNKKAI